jgi:predicted PurR-regulated permease PerM
MLHAIRVRRRRPSPPPAAPPASPRGARTGARARALLAIGAGLVLGYLVVLYVFSVVLAIVGAGAAYYLLSPVVRWLERRGVPRWLGAVLLIATVAGGALVALSNVIPRAYAELRGLVSDLPRLAGLARDWLEERGLGDIASGIVDSAVQRGEALVPGGLVSWTMTAFGSLVTLGFTLVLTLYLLASADDLARAAASWMPPAHRERWIELGRGASTLLAAYVRARVVASTFVAAGYWLAFHLMDVPRALLLALLGGVFNLIPTVGPLIAAVPVLFVTAFAGLSKVVGVAIVMIVVQQIEGNVIGPLVEGRFVRLPAAVVVVVVALGNALLGVPGMFVAVPIAAVARLALDVFYRRTWEAPEPA